MMELKLFYFICPFFWGCDTIKTDSILMCAVESLVISENYFFSYFWLFRKVKSKNPAFLFLFTDHRDITTTIFLLHLSIILVNSLMTDRVWWFRQFSVNCSFQSWLQEHVLNFVITSLFLQLKYIWPTAYNMTVMATKAWFYSSWSPEQKCYLRAQFSLIDRTPQLHSHANCCIE